MATIRSVNPIVGGRNLLTDPYLELATMALNGATVVDTHPTGSPNGRSFFRRVMTTANTSSPMTMTLSPTGTGGIPVTVAEPLIGSWYASKNPGGGPSARFDMAWYTAAGASISTSSGTNKTATASWQRFSQIHTPPATAAFAQPRLQWSGTALVGQTLDYAQAQLEYGSLMSEFTDNRTIEPLLILNYGYENASRNVIIDLLNSEYPAVFLRPAASKSGTLSMLFGSGIAARAAQEILLLPTRYHFEEPAAGEEFDFVRAGSVTVTKVEGLDYWLTNVQFREVEAL